MTYVDQKPFTDSRFMDTTNAHHKNANPHIDEYLKMLSGGAELTVRELQEMAARQQKQIENQQQILLTKEQRLRYLKQEARHQQISADNEKLRKLKENVEEQELKLKKLRLLRGEVEQYKLKNGSLNSELESIKALFNEKEKELALAVAKVEELTRGLEDFRLGRMNNTFDKYHMASAQEIDRLKRELMMRNKLNDQHGNKLSTQKEILLQRKEEITHMDKRINELQQRLRKRRQQQQRNATPNGETHAKQRNNVDVNHKKLTDRPDLLANSASALNGRTTGRVFDKQDTKYRTLPHNLKISEPDVKENGALHESSHERSVTDVTSDVKRDFRANEGGGFANSEKLADNFKPKLENNEGNYANQTSRVSDQLNVGTHRGNSINIRSILSENSDTSNWTDVKTSKGAQANNNFTGGSYMPGLSLSSMQPRQADGAFQTANINDEPRTGGSGQSSPATSDNSLGSMADHGSRKRLDDNTNSHSSNDLKDARIIEKPPHYVSRNLHASTQPRYAYSVNNTDNRLSQTAYHNRVPLNGQHIPANTDGRFDSSENIENRNAHFYSSYLTSPDIGNRGENNLGNDINAPPKLTNSRSFDDLSNRNHSPAERDGEINQLSHDVHRNKNVSDIMTASYDSYLSHSNKVPEISPVYQGQPLPAKLTTPVRSSYGGHPGDRNYNVQYANHVQRYSTQPTSYADSSQPSHSLGYISQTGRTSFRESDRNGRPAESTSNVGESFPLAARIEREDPQSRSPHAKPYPAPREDVPNKRFARNRDDRSQESAASTGNESAPAVTSTTFGVPVPTPRQSQKSSVSNDQSSELPVRDYRNNSQAYQRQYVGGSSEDTNHNSNNAHAHVDRSIARDWNGVASSESERRILSPQSTSGVKSVPQYASKSEIANTYTQLLGSKAMEQYLKNFASKYKEREFDSIPLIDAVSNGTDNSDLNKSTKVDKPTFDADVKQQKTASSVKAISSFFDSISGTKSDNDIRHAPSHYLSDKPSHKVLTTPRQLRRRLSDGEFDIGDKPNSGKKIKENNMDHHDDIDETDDGSVDVFSVTNDQEPEPVLADLASATQQKLVLDVIKPTARDAEKKQFGPPYSTQVIKKAKMKESSKKKRRVSFDPLALLLDASLEGELELVKRTALEVGDVSTPNDEGITALHNAICAGHLEVVRFLIEFGADVNSPDSDGWTPLHCAASCNNMAMVKLLVDNGACIYATTISDHETAAEKCEEYEDGYDGCSQYLYSIQEKLGIVNDGVVVAVFDFEAENPDELSFQNGNKLTVLKKGDEEEKEWWWSQRDGQEGYIPRNLLGFHPRIVKSDETKELSG